MQMAEARSERRLAAILAADVVGYSRLVRVDEEGTVARLKALRAELFDPLLVEHRGRIVKLTGDGLLAEFGSIVDAVRAARAFQEIMTVRNAEPSGEGRIDFRIGVNLGDVIIDGDDIQGDGVNVAARLEGLARPGGVCVSDGVYEQVRDRLDLDFADMGEQTVKNIARPIRAWHWPPADSKTVPERLSGSPHEKPSIAVLPFINMSGDAEQEYFVDGISEDIITELSKFRWLTVISRNSTFAYKGQSVDIPAVARKLNVGYVLEGSVRKAGGRVRITAQLIEAPINEHIWAEKYDRQLDDIFDLQDEMTRTIVGMIEPELANRERTRARAKPTENMNAWEVYQRGLHHRWRFSPADIKVAHGLFDRAIALDGDFAAAHAHRAWIAYVEIMMNTASDRARTLAAGIADAYRAIELDDRDALGYCAYGFVLTAAHDFTGAAQQFRRAVDLNPSFAAAHYGLGLALSFAGNPEDNALCLQAADFAMQLSPNDPMMWTFLNLRGLTLVRTDDYDAAIACYRQAYQYPQALFWIPLGMAVCKWQLGDEAGARKTVKETLSRYPDLSVTGIVAFMGPGAAANSTYVDTLRKTGLPETTPVDR